MKLGVLFSGGKDSCLALHKAVAAGHAIACLLTVESVNPHSYMFHTPAIRWTRLQAEALGLPLLTQSTDGEKEEELADLKALLAKGKEQYSIEGIVTGAVASTYQASRIERLCEGLGLACLNPLWGYPQMKLLGELLAEGFKVVVTGVAAEPLGEEWLGRVLDSNAVEELRGLEKKWGINPAGEGGELETFVINAPLFIHQIEIIENRTHYRQDSGVLEIMEARLS